MRSNSLAEYNRKRDFAKTREPKGTAVPRGGRTFMVQKHDATRLHFDLRLELDGVLKSWAVTRGPSLDPDDKRLAVRTEDHPLSYATFEGTIPQGEYGGGTVMLWDRGTWEPIAGKSASDLKKGHLHFVLHGERMKGEWLLVRMAKRPGEKRENWLLRKVEDAEAGGSDELVARELTSISTGRTMQEIATGKAVRKAKARAGPATAKARVLPRFRRPQLATLVDHVPSGNDWLHEIKFDGYRCLLSVAGDKARIFTRSGLDWSDRFASLIEAAEGLGLPSALIDGEIVVLDPDGNPSFSLLQQSLSEGGGDYILFAFDLLEQDGVDLAGLGNLERKNRLAALVPEDGPIRLAQHVLGAGERLFDAMCRARQEGIVSKRADAAYVGRRSRNWLKVKCTRRQEFVIVGWTRSDVRGRPFKSLLVAQHRDGKLGYAGKVGTGFDAATHEMLGDKLAGLRQAKPALEVPRAEARGAQWVKPRLVAEIAFAEFTADGIIRHASFLALREDKDAREVTIEKPQPVDAEPSPVKISNPDRVIFPEAKVTKGQLAAYYERVGPLMLAFAARRPISLVRCPQGRAKDCFFQKHDSGALGDEVRQVPIREKDGKTDNYLYVEDLPGVLACIQMGTIEFHGWGSRVDAVEKPDRMIFDLDPDEGMDFAQVRRAAGDIRQQLSSIGLVSFPMLSGGKGIHVVVPLTPEAEWPAVKSFAERFSRALAEAEPERFTATMSKAKRRGRIFIDWLRNQRGSTAVLPYSARSRAGAPVAVPISWTELKDVEGANIYDVKDADKLVKRAESRSLAGWGVAAQTLPDI